MAHPRFGPKKIHELYRRLHENKVPSLSSVKRVLKRSGLVEKRPKRKMQSGGRLINWILTDQMIYGQLILKAGGCPKITIA